MARGRHETAAYAELRQTDLAWADRLPLLQQLREEVASHFEDDHGEW
jgi:hypothetical protein